MFNRMGGGVPALKARPVRGSGSLEFRFLVAVDVEGFSRRHTAEQAQVQEDLERALTRAATGAGLDRKRWYRLSTGDGELAVLPEGADGLSLVADYPRWLAAAIGEVNRGGSGPRLRVRRAIHHGAVIVSTTVYNEVIQSRLRDLRPETFRRVTVRAKGFIGDGYLCGDVTLERAPVTLGVPRPPVSAQLPAPRTGVR